MLKLENVSKSYRLKSEDLHALNDVSIEVMDGEIFGVIGYSGAGKTTLLRLLAGLETVDSGHIYVDGINIAHISGAEKRTHLKKIGVVFQGLHLLQQRNVYKNIAFPLEVSKYPKDKISLRVKELLELVGLNGRELSYPSQLSGGQKQRVAIARALACSPKILLLDEFTSALDPLTTKQILNLLLEINQKEGVTIFLITHNMEVVKSIATRILVLDQGITVGYGDVNQELTKLRFVEKSGDSL